MDERVPPASVDQALQDAFSEGGAGAAIRVVYTLLSRKGYPFLRSAVTGTTLSEDECADLLHEVTATVLEQLRRGETSTLNLGVIRRMIRFAWVEQMRRRYGRRHVLTWVADENLPDRPDPGATPEEDAISREQVTALSSHVETLPSAEREAFRIFASGMRSDEAAKQLGIEKNAYEVRVSRARRKLRNRLNATLPSKETTNEPE